MFQHWDGVDSQCPGSSLSCRILPILDTEAAVHETDIFKYISISSEAKDAGLKKLKLHSLLWNIRSKAQAILNQLSTTCVMTSCSVNKFTRCGEHFVWNHLASTVIVLTCRTGQVDFCLGVPWINLGWKLSGRAVFKVPSSKSQQETSLYSRLVLWALEETFYFLFNL